MTLGEQIKEARENKNYSQEELAELCGVSRQAVSKWENDISVPQGVNRETLNEVLGIEFPWEEKIYPEKKISCMERLDYSSGIVCVHNMYRALCGN